MQFEVSIAIEAPPERVWGILADVEHWPEWTASMEQLEVLDGDPFAAGSRVKVRQPRLPAMTWKVTRFEPCRSFAWESRSPGVHNVADHIITPDGRGGSHVVLSFRQEGWLGRIIGRMMGATMQRYVGMEAAGLKHRAEEPAPGG